MSASKQNGLAPLFYSATVRAHRLLSELSRIDSAWPIRDKRRMAFAPLAVATLLVTTAAAAPWTISTFAGTGVLGSTGDGGPATAAQITDPYGIVRGPDGAIWFCEHNGHRIRRVAPDGTINTVAGTGA